MALANTSEKFGSLTKLLHWSIFVLFVTQFFLVYYRETLPDNSPTSLQFILLHKSLGVCIFPLAILMILWRQVGKRPIMPINMSNLEILLAKITHFLLYLSMLVMPLTGYLMSSFSGYGVALFGWKLPNPFIKNEALAGIFHEIHEIASFVIIGLVSLHILAALYHHFVRKDNILKRMLFG